MKRRVPVNPKIYHIVHVDRLPSIIEDGHLWSDIEVDRRDLSGTTIGMDGIKERRRSSTLTNHPTLRVGGCVPFYFCPRSVMLYLFYQNNHPNLTYRGGQHLIIHLEADLRQTVEFAENQNQRWAFTLSNAGSSFFEDRCDLEQLSEINWDAVHATDWKNCKDGKQAEFLIERQFPWPLVTRIGVYSLGVQRQVQTALKAAAHKPRVEVIPKWYY